MLLCPMQMDSCGILGWPRPFVREWPPANVFRHTTTVYFAFSPPNRTSETSLSSYSTIFVDVVRLLPVATKICQAYLLRASSRTTAARVLPLALLVRPALWRCGPRAMAPHRVNCLYVLAPPPPGIRLVLMRRYDCGHSYSFSQLQL